jgi:hypothetical protein
MTKTALENTVVTFMGLVSRLESTTWRGVHNLIVLARSLTSDGSKEYLGELDYDAGQKLAAELLQDNVIISRTEYKELREHAIKGGFEDWVVHMENARGIRV